jgi:hypothetical protein
MDPPPATSPTAKFVPANGALFYIEPTETYVTVPLDATSSLAGFDTLPAPGHTCPITGYAWQVEDPLGSIMVYNSANAEFDADMTGTWTITLTVIAPDPTPPKAASYVNNDVETHFIEVRDRPLGLAIDVYTNRGGTGANINTTDAYGPQEHVEAFAKVVFNLAGVANKDVVFIIRDASDAILAYRVARTDSEGIAAIQYRLPWPTAPDDTFGMCSITAGVEVSEEVANDTVGFEFGYLVKIDSIVPSPSPAVRQTEVTITLTYTNIRAVDVSYVFTVVFFDAAMVPVSIDDVADVAVADTTDTLTLKYTTPSWTFIGFGVNYANAFNAYPAAGGTPYCPEVTADLKIEKL